MICGGGGCFAAEDDRASKKRSNFIDIQLEKEARERSQKLLILGAGEAGKSTFFKHLKFIASAFPERERIEWIVNCRLDLLTSLQRLFDISRKLNLEFSSEIEASSEMLASLTIEELTNEALSSNEDLRKKLIMLTEAPEILSVLKRWQDCEVAASGLSDSAPYMFSQARRIFSKDFLPTDTDILRARIRTSGIEEVHLEYNNWKFSLIDVGGQRGDRRKWMHCFNCVDAVLFCVSMAEFNLSLAESPDVNRLRESIALFEGLSGSPWCEQLPMIVFFNKMDIFIDKLKKIKFSSFISEFQGPNTAEECGKFMQAKFIEKRLQGGKGGVYCHFTTAIDPENVRLVFHSVRQIILEVSMKISGLL